jgi:hypothetical protein
MLRSLAKWTQRATEKTRRATEEKRYALWSVPHETTQAIPPRGCLKRTQMTQKNANEHKFYFDENQHIKSECLLLFLREFAFFVSFAFFWYSLLSLSFKKREALPLGGSLWFFVS